MDDAPGALPHSTDKAMSTLETQGFWQPARVISGGQTGVDRAALDWAIAHAIPHGGWCPQGRLASDGRLPDCYQLQETASAGYSQRTRANVRLADATLILSCGPLVGGSRLTLRFAKEASKPCYVLDLEQPMRPQLLNLMDGTSALPHIDTLNIAGPSETRCPGIYARTLGFLNQHMARR